MSFTENVFLKHLQKNQTPATITMSSGFVYKGVILAIDENVLEIEEKVNMVDRRAVLVYRQYVATVVRDETYTWNKRDDNDGK
jgi:sRNA-binding regulator protein Hfq